MKSKIAKPVPLKGRDQKRELANNKKAKTVLGRRGYCLWSAQKNTPHHKKGTINRRKKYLSILN